jgi:hypothetical protein
VSRLLLSCQPGIYLVDFNDGTVKVGRSRNLRGRVKVHIKTGATQVSAWALHYKGPGIEDDEINFAEFGALCVVGREGHRIGATERFQDLPFARAAELINNFLPSRWDGAIAPHLDIPLARLTEEPKP